MNRRSLLMTAAATIAAPAVALTAAGAEPPGKAHAATVDRQHRGENDPLAERVCEATWPLLEALQEYLAAHEACVTGTCSCPESAFCGSQYETAAALLWTVEMAGNLMENGLVPWPALRARYRRERESS
jgi:hypothetical protein